MLNIRKSPSCRIHVLFINRIFCCGDSSRDSFSDSAYHWLCVANLHPWGFSGIQMLFPCLHMKSYWWFLYMPLGPGGLKGRPAIRSWLHATPLAIDMWHLASNICYGSVVLLSLTRHLQMISECVLSIRISELWLTWPWRFLEHIGIPTLWQASSSNRAPVFSGSILKEYKI